MEAIFRFFRNWRIRKTKEKIAYWKTRVDFQKASSDGSYTYDLYGNLVYSASQLAVYEARLACFLSDQNNQSKCGKSSEASEE